MPAAISLRPLRYERHPNHAIAGGETERCGEDAHDLRRLAIYKNRLLKDCWICIESRLPEIFPDDCDTISAIPSLRCIEQAACDRLDPQSREVIRSDVRTPDVESLLAAVEHKCRGGESTAGLEYLVSILNVEQVWPGHWRLKFSGLCEDRDQTAGFRQR